MIKFNLKMDKILSAQNVAANLDEQQLIWIGNQVAAPEDPHLAY